MSKTTIVSQRLKLSAVRLSFPHLFSTAIFQGEDTGKFEGTFLISKDDEATKKLLDKTISDIIAEAKIKVSKEKICLKDGDDSEHDGYADCWSIKASSRKRPTLINRDRTPVAQEDEVLYPGCYVNAIIDLWVQNNTFGKRVNANLYGVQFVKDGEVFGMGNIDVSDDFDDLDDEI